MLCMMLATTAKLDYDVLVLDVQTAFLNTDVKEGSFAKMAPGNEINDKTGVPLVTKPKKNLYDLRQSSKNWFGTDDGLGACRHLFPSAQVGSVRVHIRRQD